MNRYNPIPISRTDVANLVRLLRGCADLIDTYCRKPSQQDKARQCRQQIKKLNKKLKYDNSSPGHNESPD
jgi:hypothetical protein